MVLADFGADVIKIEAPGGDRFRALASSPLWLRGKRSLALDLEDADARSQLHELVRRADVLAVSGPPQRAARWRDSHSGSRGGPARRRGPWKEEKACAESLLSRTCRQRSRT